MAPIWSLHKKPDSYSPKSLYPRLHKLKNRGIAYVKRRLFLLHVLDFNAIFANQNPLPTLRPGNFDLHTKMPGIRPCLSCSIQMSSLCRFTSCRQAEWTPLQASCLIGKTAISLITTDHVTLLSSTRAFEWYAIVNI